MPERDSFSSGKRIEGEKGYKKGDPDAPQHLFDAPKRAAETYKEGKANYLQQMSESHRDRILELVEGREDEVFDVRQDQYLASLSTNEQLDFPHDFDASHHIIRESKEILDGQIDRLISSRKFGEVIGKENPMPLRLIHPQNGKYAPYRSKLLRMVRDGTLDFDEVKHGKFGVVGFMDLEMENGETSQLACKYFDYAFLPEDEHFSKSEVTGVGQYVLNRYIQQNTSIQVPEPVFATNKILIMESIEGSETLREVLNNSPYKDEWERWWSHMKEIIFNQLQKVMRGINDPYWKADYKALDIHQGNILIRSEWLHKKPPQTDEESYKCFYLIDPIK